MWVANDEEHSWRTCLWMSFPFFQDGLEDPTSRGTWFQGMDGLSRISIQGSSGCYILLILGDMLTSSNNLLTDMVHMPYVASSISKTARFGFCNSQFCSSSLSFITPVVSLVTLVRKIDWLFEIFLNFKPDNLLNHVSEFQIFTSSTWFYQGIPDSK